MIEMNVVTNTAVSVILPFPPSLTKCSAHPIGMNTSRMLLYDQLCPLLYVLRSSSAYRRDALTSKN